MRSLYQKWYPKRTTIMDVLSVPWLNESLKSLVMLPILMDEVVSPLMLLAPNP